MKNDTHKNDNSCNQDNSHKLQEEYLNRLAKQFENTLVKPIKNDSRLKDLEPLPTFVWVGNRIFKLEDLLPTIN